MAEHALDRDSAIQAEFVSGGYTMREIGSDFGLHHSRVSRIFKGTGQDLTFGYSNFVYPSSYSSINYDPYVK